MVTNREKQLKKVISTKKQEIIDLNNEINKLATDAAEMVEKIQILIQGFEKANKVSFQEAAQALKIWDIEDQDVSE